MQPLFPAPSEPIQLLAFKIAWNFAIIDMQGGKSQEIIPTPEMGFQELLGLMAYYTTLNP